MGNIVIRSPCGRYSVQLIRPDGIVGVINYPVRVTDVMKMNPDHMVVKCSAADAKSNAPCGKILIMSPGQKLISGQTYLLYPIPVQYRQGLFVVSVDDYNSGSCTPISWAGCGTPTKFSSRRRKRHSAGRKDIGLMARVCGFDPRVFDQERAQEYTTTNQLLLRSPSSSPSASPGSLTQGMRKASLTRSVSWKPALDSIPEVPRSTLKDQFDTQVVTLRDHLLGD